MERKYKVNDSAAGDSSANGAKSKEVALEKLRKMEWKRNTQDPWHLARSNSRGNDIQERKKYNKDEDNYFEGTGVQKTKKLRRPRPSEGSPPVPPGFCVAQATPAAPQVNAWAQKKGSALFQREDEIDEDDQVMKLVLEQSLKSAEEDNKRRLERLKMTNLDLPSSSQTLCAEKDWEEEYGKENYNAKRSLDGFQEDFKDELHFVETDVKEEKPTVNQRHRSIPPRTRKISPREKSTSPSTNQKSSLSESDNKALSHNVNKNRRSTEGIEAVSRAHDNESNTDDFFEPSRPQAKHSQPFHKVNEAAGSLSSYTSHANSTILPRTSVKHANMNSDDLVTSFNSTLTFGDTQGLFEQIQEDNELKLSGTTQNFKNETPTYLAAPDSSSEKRSANPSEPSETDILLHSFIRHEPPSNMNSVVHSNVSDMSAVKQAEPNDFLTLPASPVFSSQHLNSAQCYIPHQMSNTEQHPVMNGIVGSALPGGIQISNGQDSSSSVPGSPLQNITPFGSLEKEIPSSIGTGLQLPSQIGNVPYPYPYPVENRESLTRHLQTMQLINQNLSSAVNPEYASIPTPVRGLMPGQPQYRLPTSNMMIPSFQGHNLSPLLLQHQLQQAHLQQVQFPPGYLSQMLALDAARLQQSQLSTSVAESDDNVTKEQENISQSQIQNSHHLMPQNQAQMLSQTPQAQMLSQTQAQILSQAQAQILAHNKAQMLSQNQPHLLHLQNHPQMVSMPNQPQSVPSVESSTPKQEELLQQHMLQGARTQPGGKTKEELHIEYQNAIQALMRVQEELQEAQVQSSLPAAQPQPPWGVMSPSPAMPLAVNQFFPMGMMPQVHPHLIHQSQTAGLMSPTIQHTPQSMPAAMSIGPEMGLGSEMNMTQEPTETSVGRGRGRLH